MQWCGFPTADERSSSNYAARRGRRRFATCLRIQPFLPCQPDKPSHATMRLSPSMVERLLVRPRRRDGEQVGGYVLRLASRNGLCRPRWLLSAQQQWESSALRICPLCLRNPDPVWSETWLNHAMPLCMEHRCWLTDKCSGCESLLRWSKVRFLSCRCQAKAQSRSEICSRAP